MRQISRYSYPNTRIRAMISRLLDEEFFTRAKQVEFREFIEMLKKTRYDGIIQKFSNEINPENFEIACRDFDNQMIKKISSFFTSRIEKQVILLLEERYRIDNLKFALRMWFNKQVSEKKEVTKEFLPVLRAKTIEDVAKLIQDTEYARAIESAKDTFEKTRSLYPVEMSIDRQYFLKIQNTIEHLSETDRKIARKIAGAEIDRENLSWLARIKLYYAGKVDIEMIGFIPGGMYFSEKNLKDLVKQDSSHKFLKLPEQYMELIEVLPEKISEMDSILESIIMREIRKAFVENPFTVGIPLGYIFLKQRETKRMVSLFVSKYFATKIYQ
ncbi:MAG: V-type ATPase subunit [Candidatus Ratteibacteria bacterium]